jgi:hypothetical protein
MPHPLRAIVLAILLFFAGLGVAQELTATPIPKPQATPQPTSDPQSAPPQSMPPATPSPKSAEPQQPVGPPAEQDQEKEIQKKEQSQRILGVAPQFSVTSRQNAPALTGGQKFHLFVKSAFDPFQFALAGFQAGVGQATNSFPGYGQGAAGFGKRFGASFADQLSSNFFSNYAYPVLLKEDPRYFRLGQGTIKHRILYSLAQEFVTRTDKGTRRFNFSNVLGAFSTGALSNVYYPQDSRGFGLTMSRSALSLAYGSAGGLIDEFWFDVNQKLFHKHKKPAPVSAIQPSPSDH